MYEIGISFTLLTIKTEKNIQNTGRRATTAHRSDSAVKRTIGKWSPLEKATQC